MKKTCVGKLALFSLFLFSSLFLIPSAQVKGTEKMRVAVVEFDEKGDIGTEDAGSIVAEWMVTFLGRIGKWEMVERVLLQDVLEEQGLGLTPKISPETAAEIGKVYGVKGLIVGSIMKFGRSISVTSRLIDTHNAQIIKTGEVETTKMEKVREKVDELAFLLTRAFGTLLVRSIPPEAEVYLEGRYLAKTPTRLEEVQEGEYRLLLRKEGYIEKTELATVREGETTELEVSLVEILQGKLQVESIPPGAKVYLDGTYRGETPLTLTDVPPGPHEVKLEKEGRGEYEERLIVEKGKTITVKATFIEETIVEPVPILRVVSEPKGASIYVDERIFGVTPEEIDELSPGSYTVKLAKPGYEDYEERVEVERGRTTIVKAALVMEAKLERPEAQGKDMGARGGTALWFMLVLLCLIALAGLAGG